MNTDRRLRAVNFDLSEEALKKHFSQTNPKGSYGKIAKFFEDNGFEHRQYSGYRSLNELNDLEIMDVMDKLYETFPWLDACAEKMDVTDIENIHDIKEMREVRVSSKNLVVDDKQQLNVGKENEC